METKVVLQYHREIDVWLCGECDTENPLSLGMCTVCGCRKMPSAIILKAWNEADERAEAKKVNPKEDSKIFKDDNSNVVSEEESDNFAIFIIIAIIIFFVFVVICQGGVG